MKRTICCCFLIAYLLVCCTVTSAWVEKQMTLSGRTILLKAYGDKMCSAEIPLWEAWQSGDDYRLFCVESQADDSGAERTVVREISDLDFSVDPIQNVLLLHYYGNCQILYAANRFPVNGEAVNIRSESPEESQLLLYSPDGTLPLPTGGQYPMLADSDSACLVAVKRNSPYLEKDLLHILYPEGVPGEAPHTLDLLDAGQFLCKLPHLWAAFLVLLSGLVWTVCAWAWRRRRLLLPAPLAPIGVWMLLKGVTLPGSLLPETCILDMGHYRQLLTWVKKSGVFPEVKQLLRAACQRMLLQCAVLTLIGLFLFVCIVFAAKKWNRQAEKREASQALPA